MRLGVDLGGTKIEILAMDATGQELLRRRVPTPRGSYGAIVSAIGALVRSAEAELGREGSVGIGIPGTHVAGSGRIKNANTTELNGQALWADIETELGRPIRLANDANCFALSEASDGAGEGLAVVYGVILGTGVGGGIVVHGKVLAGINGIAGEWGHNRLPDPVATDAPPPACYCGHSGCLETYISGPGFAADYARGSGSHLSPTTIAAQAASGDSIAAAACARLADRLARGLSTVVNILDPDCIVLGGGLSRLDFLYRDVPSLLKQYVFSDEVITKLVRAKHGDSSGVRGAAWLWDVPHLD